ncbi:SMI1/KNR4 family protein [Deinococcus aluminii]|uniref:Knr4/Smi1-like domain-containing protein n=1 Tax=Deinococcus aluminii TaxID=1656885 RepID=A0ABP9XF26_9DEIO
MTVQQFTDALTHHFPQLREDLRPGVRPAGLAEAERHLGQPLPPAVRDTYLACDGQLDVVPGVLLGLRWLPLDDVVREYATWLDLAGEDTGLDSRPPGAVRPVTFSPGWLPFASDGGGNGLAVDLQPGPAGTAGQVITFGPDETTRLVLASSLPAFLGWVADQIEAGRVTVEGNDVRLNGATSFLDAARTLV